MRSTWVVPVVVVVLLAGCAVAEEPPPLSPADLVPVLAQPQEPFDVIPVAETEGIDPASTRFLGSAEGVSWWVGASEDPDGGSTCLIMTDFDENPENAMYACMTPTMLYDWGTVVSSEDSGTGAGAYLIPNDVDVTPLKRHLDGALTSLIRQEGMPAARAMAQDRVTLITFRPQDVTEASFTLQRASGEPIIFNVS